MTQKQNKMQNDYDTKAKQDAEFVGADIREKQEDNSDTKPLEDGGWEITFEVRDKNNI